MKFTYSLLLLAALVCSTPVRSQSYYLDHSFGTNGCLGNLSQTPNSRVNDIAVQKDGKIVGILHNNLKFQVFRLKKNGAPDATFGINGFVDVVANTSVPNTAISLALQADDKIVVAGRVKNQDKDIAVLRLNVDGTIDENFGQQGWAIKNTYSGCDEEVQKLLLRPDGKILVAARRYIQGEKTKELFVQFDTDGNIDNGFGNNGVAVGNHDDNDTYIESAALQADGKIVTTGYTYIGQVSNSDVYVTRYNADGSLDNGFGNQGKVIKDFVSLAKEDGRRVLIQSTGKIVIACYAPSLSFMTFRLNSDGSADTRYGNKGISSLDINLSDFSFDAILLGNEILIGGNVQVGGVYDFNIVRFDKNGKSRYTFGVHGTITTDVFGYSDYLFALALQPDGKIIAAGSSVQAIGGLPYPSMVRYVANPVNGVENVERVGVVVYPNPNTGAIRIITKAAATLYIYNSIGQLLKTAYLNAANNYSATISDLPTGINLIRNETGTYYSKVVTVPR